MKLSQFFEETGMPITIFSKRSGVTTATLYNLFQGRDVRGSVLISIERATKGKVSAKEIYEEYVEEKE